MQKEFSIEENRRVVTALTNGDKSAFRVIYTIHFARLRNYATVITQNPEVANELVQDLFLALWDRRHKLNPDQPIRNYLIKATHNNSLRYCRKMALNKRHEAVIVLEKMQEQDENIINFAESDSRLEQLHCAIKNLPERSRNVLIMKYMDGQSSAEIAENLSISVRTVETILYQSIKKLRKNVHENILFLVL